MSNFQSEYEYLSLGEAFADGGIELIGVGNTAEVYAYEEDKVIKLFKSGLNREIIEREYINSTIVSDILKGVVPKTYGLVEVDGRRGIVYEKIVGKDFLKILLSSVWMGASHGKKLAHYHFNINVQVNRSLTTLKEKLLYDLSYVKELDENTKEKIREYINKLPNGDRLCHFDFHPGNIIITADSPIIVDWMNACAGEALADVARTSIMLKYAEIPNVPWAINKLVGKLKGILYRGYIKEYLKISGENMEDVEKWYLPIAAARLNEWIPISEKKRLIQLVEEKLVNSKKTESLK